jgi:hypothetical protein
MIGADPSAGLESGTPLRGKVNYLTDKDPAKRHVDISTYGVITYTGIYPGIDLAYSGDRQSLRSAYTISPGADPSDIRWSYSGAQAEVDGAGNLNLKVQSPKSKVQSDGAEPSSSWTLDVGLSTPSGWQEAEGRRIPVGVRYALSADGTVGLALDGYDRAKPLVVDTGLAYPGSPSDGTAASTSMPAPPGPAASYLSQPAKVAQTSTLSQGSTVPHAPQAPLVLPALQLAGPFPQFRTRPLAQIAPLLPVVVVPRKERERENEKFARPAGRPVIDPVVQSFFSFSPLAIPTPIHTFEGISNRDGVTPPDTNGDVGPNHYVQMVNTSFQIFKKDGTSVYGPTNINVLWNDVRPGTPCAAFNDGDPHVLHDQIADRWIVTQFVAQSANPAALTFAQCIAISTGPDPAGSWYVSEIPRGLMFGDYPKFGVWPDAYYFSTVDFDSSVNASGVLSGTSAIALERDTMLTGSPYRALVQRLPPPGADRVLLPSDFDGEILPPAGAPNVFAAITGTNTLELFQFHVDWTNPAFSTFTGPVNLTTALFDPAFNCPNPPPAPGFTSNCVRQPGTAVGLDALADRLMHRLAYRNFGDHESLVANHTVDADGTNHAGVRWYEIRDPYGTPSIFQQGTFAPDGASRWMGSIAMDRNGNIGLGYSVSDSSTFPSIRYTGRLASDPAGTLPQGEGVIRVGGGSQLSTSGRWGDYSQMAIDPTDDCTFWYTTEYLATTSQAGWKTRIGTFKFPGCEFSHSTYLGSGSIEEAGGYYGTWDVHTGGGVAVDGYGNVYMVGRTHSLDFPVTEDALQSECNTCGDDYYQRYLSDAYVTKIHVYPDGTAEVFYSTYLGGSSTDYAMDVAVDASQNIYVTGSTASDDFPTTAGAFQPSCPSCEPRSSSGGYEVWRIYDAFVTKIISDGSGLAYSTYLGSVHGPVSVLDDDHGMAIAVDVTDHAYVTGYTNSQYFPKVNPAFNTGGAFLSKLAADGSSLVYSTQIKGTSRAFDVAINGDGQAHVVGLTQFVDFPVVNAFQSEPGHVDNFGYPNDNGFIAKFNAAGNGLVYASYMGGGTLPGDCCDEYSRYLYYWHSQEARSVAVDAQGDAYVAGVTAYAGFPVTAGAYRTSCNNCGIWPAEIAAGDALMHDAFVTKVYTTGALLWSTYLGGRRGDMANSVAVSPNGSVYVAGATWSPDFPLVDAPQAWFGGEDDAFFSVLNPSGSALLKSTYLGGTGIDYNSGMALQGDQPYITGFTLSPDYPVSEHALFPNYRGGQDAFLTKLGVNTALQPPAPPAPCGPAAEYLITSGGGSVTPGTSLVPGSRREVGNVDIPLPFEVKIYGTSYDLVHASVNGVLQFGSNYPDHDDATCLPTSLFSDAILAYWDDLDLSTGITTTFVPGIYTATTGTAPNRTFLIEYRACLFSNGGCDGKVNFEVSFHEGQDDITIIYGTVASGNLGATIGVQKGSGLRYTQRSCGTPVQANPGLRLIFYQPPCPEATPTNTPYPTNTRAGPRPVRPTIPRRQRIPKRRPRRRPPAQRARAQQPAPGLTRAPRRPR